MAEAKLDNTEGHRPITATPPDALASFVGLIERTLDDGKAEDIVTIDLAGKSSFADWMIVASGRSARQVSALADQLITAVKQAGHPTPPVEGKEHGDWVLVDAGDVIVHLFRPEVRVYYNLEKMWLAPVAAESLGEAL